MSGETHVLTYTELLFCIAKGSISNTAVNANTNYFTTGLTPSFPTAVFRIYIVLQADNVVNVRRTVGATTTSEALNGGVALKANCAYMFDIKVETGDTINLQHATANTTISKCIVSEVPNW